METWLEEILPRGYLRSGAVHRVTNWLRVSPLGPEDRKFILVTWCEYTGVPLSRSLVEASGAD